MSLLSAPCILKICFVPWIVQPEKGATGRLPLGLEDRTEAWVVAPVALEPEQLPGLAKPESFGKDGPAGGRSFS